MSIPRLTEIVEKKMNRGRFIVTSTISEYAIDNGLFYSVEHVVTIANAGDTDILLDSSLLPANKSFIANPTFWNTTAGPVIITLGVCTSCTGGTELTPTNRNFQGPLAKTVFKHGVTPTGFSASDTTLLVGSATTPQFSGGGSLTGGNIIILNPNLVYVFNVANEAGEEIKVGFRIEWAEIDLSLVPSGG